METLMRDVSRVVFFTAPLVWFHILFDSVCRTKKTLNTHCTKHHTHSQSLSLPLLRSCFSPLYVNVYVCVYFHYCRSLSAIMRPHNVLSVFQESEASQATGVHTFLRFRSLAERERAQIVPGRSGEDKASTGWEAKIRDIFKRQPRARACEDGGIESKAVRIYIC